MRAISAASPLAAKKGLSATWDQSSKGTAMSPSWLMQPMNSVPYCCLSHSLAIAAAPTTGAVRRADERPPPRGSRTPYLCQ